MTKYIYFLLFFTISSFANANDYTHIFGLILEKNSLSDVQNILGKAKVYKSGDASTSSHRINYFIKKENLYLTFDSGEMGGGTYISSFILSKNKPKEKFTINKRAQIKNTKLKELFFKVSKDDFEKIFNKKFEKTSAGEKFIYFEKRIAMSSKEKKHFKLKENDPNGYFDEYISISPVFKNKKIIKLEIYKATTF